MRTRIRRQLTFANLMALLALVLVTGGTSYALSIPRNSVGSAQLKRGAVGHSDIKADAVTSLNVKSGTLLARDFKRGQLPAGPQGPQGAQGPTGPQGPQGPAGPASTASLVEYRALDGASSKQIGFAGGFLNASCQGSTLGVQVRPSGDNNFVSGTRFNIATGTTEYASPYNFDFDAGESDFGVLVPQTVEYGTGILVYRAASGPVTTITYAYDYDAGGVDCLLEGTATQAG